MTVRAWIPPAALDALYEGVALCDATGSVQHANHALRLALREISELESALGNFIRALPWGRTTPGGPLRARLDNEWVEEQIVLGDTHLRLRGAPVQESSDQRPAAWLVAYIESGTIISDAELRRRFDLSPQQLRVARLLADGRTNREIAARLQITERTARTHTERVFRKIGVRSRAAVASRILGRGQDVDRS